MSVIIIFIIKFSTFQGPWHFVFLTFHYRELNYLLVSFSFMYFFLFFLFRQLPFDSIWGRIRSMKQSISKLLFLCNICNILVKETLICAFIYLFACLFETGYDYVTQAGFKHPRHGPVWFQTHNPPHICLPSAEIIGMHHYPHSLFKKKTQLFGIKTELIH
jgi:hypothetical protein